jgi:excisionase family DNA binding protein
VRVDYKNHASIKSEPVLLFDNRPSGFNTPVELLTVTEAAEFLRISKTGIRRLQQGRHLPFFKVLGSVRFSKADLLSYLEQARVRPIG